MIKIIECVPNFSEGNDEAVLNSITAAITSVDGITLLDVDPGKDTNRTVVTFVGDPDNVIEAAFQAIKTASQLIDMTKHKGTHPRMGATDVCPLIPIKNTTMEECIEYSKILAKKVAKELNIPVYLYENSATKNDRVNLSNIRSGEFEGMCDKIKDKKWKPDYGPVLMPNNAGVTAIGAREFLLAYNINLNTCDKKLASHIALNIREAGRAKRDKNGKIIRDKNGVIVKVLGSLKSTKAVGWYLEEYGIAQVSMNLINYNITSLHDAFEEVRKEANSIGLRVTGSEIVGLVPLEPLIIAGNYYLKKQKSSLAISEKNIVQFAIRSLGLSEISRFNPNKKIINYMLESDKENLVNLSINDFADEVSSSSPAPGGGSVSALSGSLGAALMSMVSNLTYNKKGYETNNQLVSDIGVSAQGLKKDLLILIDKDTEAFDGIMLAFRLPKKTKNEQKDRDKAILAATKNAIDVPLLIMKKSSELLYLMNDLIKYGNKNSLSDGAVSIELLMTSIRGAYYNVKINLKDIQDSKYIKSITKEADLILNKASNCYKKLLRIINKEL